MLVDIAIIEIVPIYMIYIYNPSVFSCLLGEKELNGRKFLK